MSFAISKLLVLTAIAATAALGTYGQPSGSQASGQAFVGEMLTYEAKVDKILRGITVAELTFAATSEPASNQIVIKSAAVSKGTLLKLFRFSFLQEYESTLDLNRFRILKTTKHDVQKQRVRDSEAVFDYAQRMVTFIETDPKDSMRPPRRIASEIGEQVYDMISAIYAVRLLPLAVGQKLEFSVSDSGLVYKVPFTVTAREVQKTVFGKISCFRVEPEIFGTGRLIEQKGKMVIWMTEDARHVPVRAQVETSLGEANIKLKSYLKPVPGPPNRAPNF